VSVYCGDGEPVAYYRETRRTARKQHDCCACEIPIQPGHTYWVIATCYDGSVRGWKRCARCQLIHVELRPLCSENDEWPDEKLNCGHTFEENYGCPPPAWMAALAFWQPGDPLPQVNPCAEWKPRQRCRSGWGLYHRCQAGTLPWRCWPSRMAELCANTSTPA
jgi:hypothetical protein